jgi:hypothetical protein
MSGIWHRSRPAAQLSFIVNIVIIISEGESGELFIVWEKKDRVGVEKNPGNDE